MSTPDNSSDPITKHPEPEKTAIYNPQDTAAELVRVLDEYLSDLQAGLKPDKVRLLAEHPDLADQLEECLAGIEFVHRAGKPQGGTPTQLGDFRIVREVGRGGMGVVYEAEQLSLKRKVALKVLRFGITADAEVMKRFQREAETVAHLHHTNIVPIHAVGCEEGVHYYAMQFIEGRSLATVVEEYHTQTSLVDGNRFLETAKWILQAAEALAYAHQRGVIHRDVKPSNLILDPEETVWLTDFGLAKRADEVTMTAAGVVMGTPRYMSPEQAAAARQPIDHRTDIYSLGATLYELATGKPVFDSATPQGVITQILNAEPVAPRVVQGKLPRDLETIILKCLAKEPGKRYQQAQDLADDLRAYLENRPIRARRASLVERAARWAKKHQRSTAVSAVSIAASLLVICCSIVGWNAYQKSLQGQLVLTTDGPSLVAEVLNDRDELVVPSFPVPTPQPVEVPAGKYRVRLSAPGTLSETWHLAVERGQLNSYPVALIDRTLAPPLEVRLSETPRLIEVDGRPHFFYLGEQGWRLVRGDTFQSVWPRDLGKLPEKPDEIEHPQTALWDAWKDLLQFANSWGQTGNSPGLAETSVDINQDRRGDLILASRVSPSLLAISGVDGQVLWWYRASPVYPPDHDVQQDPIDLKGSSEDAGVIGRPLVVDHGGEPVIVAMYASSGSSVRTKSGKNFRAGRQYYVEAVRARTGKQIWRSKIDFEDFPNVQLAEVLRVFPEQPDVVTCDGKQTVLVTVHTKIHGFDLATGDHPWPARDLGQQPWRTPRYADLNGDKSADAMFVIQSPQSTEQGILKVLSLSQGAFLWERSFHQTDRIDNSYHQTIDNDIVWVADLDQDGKPEVIAPNTDDWQHGGPHWYGIEVYDGGSGAVRWQQRLWTSNENFSSSGSSNGSIRVLIGPDLNGDGHLELFASSISRSMFTGKSATRVDALSGQDGNVVWRQELNSAGSPFERKSTMLWWQVGEDGWPQLVLPLEKSTNQQPVAYVFAASTGRLQSVVPEVTDPYVADLNADGIPDLYHLQESQGSRRLASLKGLIPVNWRRSGQWRTAPDYDGDGASDLLSYGTGNFRPSQLEAFSGKQVQPLWKSELQSFHKDETLLTSVDINSDGVRDLVDLENVSARTSSFYAMGATSGKDGKRLWSGASLGTSIGQTACSGGGAWCNFSYPLADEVDLDQDGHAEVLAAYTSGNLLTLSALSPKDGRSLWSVPILAGAYTGRSLVDRHIWHDLNGDGVLDIVLLGPQKIKAEGVTEGMVARAYSGKDGQALWKDDGELKQSWFLWPRPAIGDLEGDGIAEVAITTNDGKGWDSKAGGYQCELLLLDGRSGQKKWSWPWVSSALDLWPPLLVDLAGDGHRTVCMGVQRNTPTGTLFEIVMFSSDGQLLKQVPVDLVNSSQPWMALDVDNDRHEELLYISNGALGAFRGLEQQAIWNRPATQRSRITDYRSGTRPESGTLVLREDRSVHGINSANGMSRWRCEIPRIDQYEPTTTLSETKSPVHPPIVVTYSSHSQSSISQTAWPTTPTGNYQPPPGKPIQFTEFVGPVRWRPLPWRFGAYELILSVVFYTLLVRWVCLHQWRRVASTLLPLAMMIIAITAIAFTVSPLLQPGERYSWDGWYGVLVIAGSIMCLILFVINISRWCVRRMSRMIWGSPTVGSPKTQNS